MIEPLKLPWPADKRMEAPCWVHHSMSARVLEKHFVFHSQYPHPSFIPLPPSSFLPCLDMEQSSRWRRAILVFKAGPFPLLCPRQTSRTIIVLLLSTSEGWSLNREAGQLKQHIHNVAGMQHIGLSSEKTPCWALVTFGCLYLWKIQPINLLSPFPQPRTSAKAGSRDASITAHQGNDIIAHWQGYLSVDREILEG